ncbi:MAG: hypothetical protein J0L56_03505 [Chitinophagales bacterium]|nr:hypothetical protein [Chitinophagales bacterium]
MTHYTIQPLIIGIIFLLVSVGILAFSKRKKRRSVISFAIGVFLIIISTVGPLSKSRQKVNEVEKIDSTKVERILIQPTNIPSSQSISLVTNEIIVTNRETLNSLSLALRHTVLTDEDFLKNPDSVCRIRIEMKDKTNIVFGVRISGRATSIEVDSKGESGWHYAKLQANEFGQILKEICK